MQANRCRPARAGRREGHLEHPVDQQLLARAFELDFGALIAGQTGDLNEALAATLGGTTALGSHAAKTSLRLAVNASPEPFSNIALSLSENTAVVGVLLLAVDHPWAAFAIALALLLLASTLSTLAIRRVRRGLRHLRGRFFAGLP